MRRIFLATTVLAMLWCRQALAVFVVSNSDCPSSDVIKEKLVGLVEGKGSDAARAMIDVQKEVIHIELSSYGERPRQRTLSSEGSCVAKAESVALVIAAWLDDVPTKVLTAPQNLPPKETAPVQQKPLPIPLRPSRQGWLGLGAMGVLDDHDLGAGVMAEFALPHMWRGWGGQMEGSMMWPLEKPVGQGSARLYRPSLFLAITHPWERGFWVFTPSLGLTSGMLIVKGRGYDTNRTSYSWMWGPKAEMRITRVVKRRAYWLGTQFTLWPDRPTIRSVIKGTTTTVQSFPMSYWELQIAFGMSLQLF